MKKNARRSKSSEKGQKRKKREGISGFSTINQVAGISKPKKHHSSLPVEDPKKINEPHVMCQYCGTVIENIASALSTAEGGYAHFDCVLGRIKESERLEDGEVVSYLGSGSFGIVGKNEEGKDYIIRRIQYETPERYKSMKDYVEGLKV